MPFCPAPPAAWKLVATIARRSKASCSALSGSIATIVVQFGLATIPLWASSASGLTSDTTSGTASSIRNALELSTTTAPPSTKRCAHSRERVAPAENSATSKPWTFSSVSAATTRPPSSSRPTERSDANGTISDAGKSR